MLQRYALIVQLASNGIAIPPFANFVKKVASEASNGVTIVESEAI